MYQRFPSDRKEGARFRRPGAVAISVPSRGVLARQGNGSCGQGPLVCFRFRPLTKASFRRARNQKQPVAFATSCRSSPCGESESIACILSYLTIATKVYCRCIQRGFSVNCRCADSDAIIHIRVSSFWPGATFLNRKCTSVNSAAVR